MTDQFAIGLLSIAATLDVAAIAAFGWLIKLALQLDRQQTTWRHEMRNDLQNWLNRAEDGLTRRVERLEQHSFGYRAWHEQQRPDRDDDR